MDTDPAMMRAQLPSLHPYIGRDVPWLLETQAALYGDKIFLNWVPFEGPEDAWSYAALLDRAARIGGGCRRAAFGWATA